MKAFNNKKNLRESYNSTIFSNIYKNNNWGGPKGEFYSGHGSHNKYIEKFANVVVYFIIKNNIQDIIEIGCGDFHVSNIVLSKLNDIGYAYSYIGYDVVKPLISRNNALFGTPSIKFVCKDSSAGNIKGGDLLLIRQVLQHLNNNAIKQIVEKFNNYKYILVTEHQASEKYGDLIKPNLDQPTGASIRLGLKSGVYLDKAPYNCKIASKVFDIPQPCCGLDAFINTYLIMNENS